MHEETIRHLRRSLATRRARMTPGTYHAFLGELAAGIADDMRHGFSCELGAAMLDVIAEERADLVAEVAA